MSNHLTSMVYKRDLGSIARKAVMVLLADKASDDGSGIWASKQRMADELCASKQTVLNTLKSLAADGLIAEVGKRKCANGYTVEYAINTEKLDAVPLVKWHDYQSTSLTGQNAGPVKEIDPTSQRAGPDQSTSLTQTPLNRSEPLKTKKRAIPANWWPEQFGPNTKSRRIVDGWDADTLATQVEAFTAHHTKVGSKFECWQSAWSTWVLNSEKFKPRQAPHQRGGSMADIGNEVREMFNGRF